MGAKYFLLWLSRRFGKKRFQITNISEKTGTISINFYLTNLYLWIIIKTQHKMLFFTFPIGNWYPQSWYSVIFSVIGFTFPIGNWYLSDVLLISLTLTLYLSHRELILVKSSKICFTSSSFTFPIGNWYGNIRWTQYFHQNQLYLSHRELIPIAPMLDFLVCHTLPFP